MSFLKQPCMICGGVIDEHLPRIQKYCSNVKCKWKYFDRIRRQSLDMLKCERESLNLKARDLRNDAAEAAWIENPKDFIPVAIPFNMRCIKRLPEKRRLTFCDRLKELFDQVSAEQCLSIQMTVSSTKQTKLDTCTQGAELHSLLINACAVCRGSCCKGGGDHAYLTVDTILRYMRRHPELQLYQILEKYLFFLPKKTYEDSCVYHAEFGCSLPRHMRSESCNCFVCHGLADIEEYAVDTKSTRFFIAAMEGKKELRSAFVYGNKILRNHKHFS